MFKEILSGLKKVFSRKLIIVLVILALGAVLLSYSNSKSFSMDGMEAGFNEPSSNEETNSLAQTAQTVSSAPAVSAPVADFASRPVNTASDLLPANENSEWARLNPGLSAGGMPDLLSAGYHTGICSVPLRNANLQLRSDPVIPKQDVGPWNASTIEPDLGRVPLEIGYQACA